MEQNTTSPAGKKIDLMIIGAQKAGTTSLKNYLGQHPSLATHPQKEFSYFFDKNEYDKGFDAALKKYFANAEAGKKLVAKNAGLYVSEAGIKRLKDHNPECRIVLIMRNPVLRTYSSYLMERNYGAVREPFDSIRAIAEKADSSDWRFELLIGMSIYHRHLEMVYRYFPKEQVQLVRFTDMERNPGDVCRKLFAQLEVSTDFKTDTSVRHNETIVNLSPRYGRLVMGLLDNNNPIKKIAKKVIPDQSGYKIGEALRNINKTNRKYKDIPLETARFLADYFAPYNRKLSELTGMDFSYWNEIFES